MSDIYVGFKNVKSTDKTGYYKTCKGPCGMAKDLCEFQLIKGTFKSNYRFPAFRKDICRRCNSVNESKQRYDRQKLFQSSGTWTCECGWLEVNTNLNCRRCGLPKAD